MVGMTASTAIKRRILEISSSPTISFHLAFAYPDSVSPVPISQGCAFFLFIERFSSLLNAQCGTTGLALVTLSIGEQAEILIAPPFSQPLLVSRNFIVLGLRGSFYPSPLMNCEASPDDPDHSHIDLQTQSPEPRAYIQLG
jgi:hypothetical protein